MIWNYILWQFLIVFFYETSCITVRRDFLLVSTLSWLLSCWRQVLPTLMGPTFYNPVGIFICNLKIFFELTIWYIYLELDSDSHQSSHRTKTYCVDIISNIMLCIDTKQQLHFVFSMPSKQSGKQWHSAIFFPRINTPTNLQTNL